MGQAIYTGTLNTFSVGGSSQLEVLENAEISITPQTQNGASLYRAGGYSQETKRRGVVRASLFSGTPRVQHIDLSAAAVGAVDLLAIGVQSLAFNINVPHELKPGAGEEWEFPVPVNRIFSASLRLGILDSAAPQLLLDILSDTYANRSKTLAFTIAGTSISVPMRMSGATIPISQNGLQVFDLSLDDESGVSGSTVLPSGTTSLLQKIFNDWQTALAFSFVNKAASNNITISGNMVWSSFAMNITDGQLLPFQYEWATQGEVDGV